MGLSRQEIQELLKKPKNKTLLSKAIADQDRLKFHIDTAMRNVDSNALRDFLKWVESLLPSDKYIQFTQLLKFPIPTNELTDEICTALSKVNDGKDAYKDYNFRNPELINDWLDYNAPSEEFWNKKALEISKTEFNGFLVVDLAQEQTTTIPEPYFFFLPVCEVSDFDYNKDGFVKWLFTVNKKGDLLVYDDETYRVFELTEKNELKGDAIIEEPHYLGKCPVRFFWTDSLKSSGSYPKKTPLSNQVSALDWLLFFQTSKKNLDLYAAYPIYSGYEQECDYENGETGDYCDKGFVKNQSGDYYTDVDGLARRCPVCESKRITGAGSFVEVPVPNEDNDNTDLRNPVQITTIDRPSLDYNVEETERLWNNIYASVVGSGGKIRGDKAFNEAQITATTESLRNVLIHYKENFELAREWVEDTICQLRYGDLYLSTKISLGTDFYLYNTEQLNTIYKQAKESGSPDYILDDIQEQILATEHKGNPNMFRRSVILMNLEPYRHQSRSEVLDMLSKGFGDKTLVAIKLNFSNFVMRFERENTNVVDFGQNLEFDKKIDIITQKFKEYANTEQNTGSQNGQD